MRETKNAEVVNFHYTKTYHSLLKDVFSASMGKV